MRFLPKEHILKRTFKRNIRLFLAQATLRIKSYSPAKPLNSTEIIWSFTTSTLAFICLLIIILTGTSRLQKMLSPLVASLQSLHPLKESKKGYQVYGYAPYWTFDKLDHVDYKALTTLAYFGVPLDSNGDLVKDDPGYDTFMTDHATEIFKKAHNAGTKVILTITQMDNQTIMSFLDNPDAQRNGIDQITNAIKNRGIDGVSIDFEYLGDPGINYRSKFSQFVANVSKTLHEQLPGSTVTVDVYASSAKDPRLYDLASLSNNVNQIFMMAYDFATANADNATPTAPLYGYKQGKYSYDVSTAVEDFLKVMPANKIVLGVPYYGYNYSVYQPQVNSATLPYWTGQPAVQTYSVASENIKSNMDGIDAYTHGWDKSGQVGWQAYHVTGTNTWRMIFVEDTKSLGLKYDFAKSKNLAGIGIWALGFDDGHPELWSLLHEKFGVKLADSRGLLYK